MSRLPAVCGGGTVNDKLKKHGRGCICRQCMGRDDGCRRESCHVAAASLLGERDAAIERAEAAERRVNELQAMAVMNDHAKGCALYQPVTEVITCTCGWDDAAQERVRVLERQLAEARAVLATGEDKP